MHGRKNIKVLTKVCRAAVSFLKIGPATVVFYSGAEIKFCPYFPYLLTDLSKIRLMPSNVYEFREKKSEVGTIIKRVNEQEMCVAEETTQRNEKNSPSRKLNGSTRLECVLEKLNSKRLKESTSEFKILLTAGKGESSV